jgi:signal transduction histidine kinase/ActR/RegA family two-component response regulator
LERKRELTAESMIDEETDFVMLLNVVSHTALLLRKREGFPYEDWKVGQEFPFDRIPSEKSINLVDEEDRPAVTGFFHQDNLVGRLREKSVIMQIYRFHHQDGSLRRKKLRAFYLDSIHEDVVIAGRDITDIYQEEQEQKRILQDALDEAKTASRAKSDFLSRMSHDLRTPMNVIIGLTSIAMEDFSESSAETKRLLSDISNSANYLLSLINDCLDLEKITSGKFELHPSVCPYADVFDGIRTVITPLCEKKGIGFVMTGPKDGGPAVLADKMRLKQVFFNLLSNSVKFTPSGGKIEFLVRNNSISDGRNRFECIVRDDGIGMSEEFQSHMFEPFSQETNSISLESQGSGLGLSIVKQLVDLMGATIHVRSRLGEGTEFTLCFDFPVAKEPARMDAVPMPASRAGLKGKRILLAEDHPLNTMIAVRLLEKEGMKVTTAANGEIALDAFRRSPGHFFDAVLLDIRMPVLNGLETARAIRSLDRSDAKTVPVIAMTANAFDSDVEESLKAGMNAHLSKPIDPEKLYDTLSACMA